MEHDLMTVGQVAARLRCGQSTIWRWVAAGKFVEPIRINGVTRFDSRDVDSYLAEQRGTTRIVVRSSKSRVRNRPTKRRKPNGNEK